MVQRFIHVLGIRLVRLLYRSDHFVRYNNDFDILDKNTRTNVSSPVSKGICNNSCYIIFSNCFNLFTASV